ncbi:MAG: MATE family efflux transporter [Deltaproteobacteria bacterium]|nr:MATE family efflux transporter [Nannocystaceae bacterium]
MLKLSLELPLVRRVLRVGTWVMLAMITQFFVNYFDTLMVGYLEGPIATASQAALGLGMPLFWAVGGAFAAIGVGTQAIVARRFAEGDHAGAGAALFNCLVLATGFGLAAGAFGYFITPPGIDFLASASEEQKQLGVTYTQIRMLGVPGMVMTFSFKAFFDGLGRTWVHLYAALWMNVLNIGMNYLLIFGSEPLGIPRMELAGAAIASSASTYLGFVIMAGVSFRKELRAKFDIYHWRHIDPKIMARITKLMIPSGLATVILMAGFALFMKFVGDIDAARGDGTNTLTAATKAIMDTTALCFMPAIAFGTATATAVSQSLGAGKPNLAARYGWESVRLGIYAMCVIGVVFFAIPEQIIGLLAPHDEAVRRLAAPSLRIVVAGLPMMAVGLILAQALYGAGANNFVAGVEFTLHFGCLVPLSWLLGPKLGYGLEGVWTAAVIYTYLLGGVMAWKFYGTSWRKIRL